MTKIKKSKRNEQSNLLQICHSLPPTAIADHVRLPPITLPQVIIQHFLPCFDCSYLFACPLRSLLHEKKGLHNRGSYASAREATIGSRAIIPAVLTEIADARIADIFELTLVWVAKIVAEEF